MTCSSILQPWPLLSSSWYSGVRIKSYYSHWLITPFIIGSTCSSSSAERLFGSTQDSQNRSGMNQDACNPQRRSQDKVLKGISRGIFLLIISPTHLRWTSRRDNIDDSLYCCLYFRPSRIFNVSDPGRHQTRCERRKRHWMSCHVSLPLDSTSSGASSLFRSDGLLLSKLRQPFAIRFATAPSAAVFFRFCDNSNVRCYFCFAPIYSSIYHCNSWFWECHLFCDISKLRQPSPSRYVLFAIWLTWMLPVLIHPLYRNRICDTPLWIPANFPFTTVVKPTALHGFVLPTIYRPII